MKLILLVLVDLPKLARYHTPARIMTAMKRLWCLKLPKSNISWPPKQVIPLPRDSVHDGDYRQDRPFWVDQSFPDGKQASTKNIACHQCYAQRQYSPDCRLSYRSWKTVISIFQNWPLDKQKQDLRSSVPIAIFTNHDATEQPSRAVRPTGTINQAKHSIAQTTCGLLRL